MEKNYEMHSVILEAIKEYLSKYRLIKTLKVLEVKNK
jgi:hypothetical protein